MHKLNIDTRNLGIGIDTHNHVDQGTDFGPDQGVTMNFGAVTTRVMKLITNPDSMVD